MMEFNTKLFFSTFVLIFLAELGDKTQLAAMASSATGGKATVFLAASAALVLSTALAVLFGSVLTRILPPFYIKVAAGILFLVFGALILFNAFTPEKAPAESGAAPVPASPLVQWVLNTALAFEECAAVDYEKAAAKTTDDNIRRVLLSLAREEQQHVARLREAYASHPIQETWTQQAPVLPEPQLLAADIAEDARPILEHAIEHELATARFYNEMAKASKIEALQRMFTDLAQSERNHAAQLQSLRGA